MIKKSKLLNSTGYIEGYYGKLLDWNDRFRIIDKLNNNGMTKYLYAPKEDVFHRLEWRKLYPQNIVKSFISLVKFAKKKDVEIIFGIAPGIDFNYLSLNKNFVNKNHSDLDNLKKKCQQIISFGITNILIMFDDIDVDKYFDVNKKNNEGSIHAKITNHLTNIFKINFLTVPRVYSDELIPTNKYYLKDFFETLNTDVGVFYCGKNIVTKNLGIQNIKKFKKYNNDIIIWDNFYANDYCPKKIFLGRLIGRKITSNIMMNLTGMVETDLFLLDVYYIYLQKKNSVKNWNEVLKKHKVPNKFILISNLLKNPFANLDRKKNVNDITKYIIAIDYLLWKWKSPLSREWYSFLFNLKSDLLIRYNLASTKKILKTETLPLGEYLIRNRF